MYYDATVSFSKETRDGILIGILATAIFVLFDAKQPVWHAVTLFTVAVCAVMLVADSDWVKQRALYLSILTNANVSEQVSRLRLLIAVFGIGFVVLILAAVTWPPKEVLLQPVSVVAGVQPATPTDPSSTVVGIPDPPKKTTPPADVPKGAPSAKPHIAKPKPVPESKPHPVIIVSKTTMTTNPDTKRIEVVVTLANLSTVETNVHLLFDITWNGEPIPGTIQTREVAFAPAPFSFEMTFSTTPMGMVDYEYTNKIHKLSIVINASYPDQGGTTTYSYQGDILPNASRLDDQATSWTPAPAKQ